MPDPPPQVWSHTCELFDNYLLACFVLFSGVSLETLVWQVRGQDRGWGQGLVRRQAEGAGCSEGTGNREGLEGEGGGRGVDKDGHACFPFLHL